MIRYLTLSELLVLYQHVIEQSGGLNGVRSIENLESAVAQPRMTFEGQDIYPSPVSYTHLDVYKRQPMASSKQIEASPTRIRYVMLTSGDASILPSHLRTSASPILEKP